MACRLWKPGDAKCGCHNVMTARFQGQSRMWLIDIGTYYTATPALVKPSNPPPQYTLKLVCLVKSALTEKKALDFMSIIPDGSDPCHNYIYCYAMIRENSLIHPHSGERIKV